MDALDMSIAHGTPCSRAAAGAQWWNASARTQSGCPLPSPAPAHKAARYSANGAARPSKASQSGSSRSPGTSLVDSAPAGRPSALDARERERHEVDGPSAAPERREAREVARRGDVGHAVAPRR